VNNDFGTSLSALVEAAAEDTSSYVEVRVSDLRTVLASVREVCEATMYSECMSAEAFGYEERIAALEAELEELRAVRQ